ncbi:hypothetical protein [Archangium sp.]|uniref:hypothetical protein n=1 Tax=Archangium sp. TaxID=1872627 RepID=UPI002ED78ED6
MTVLLLAVAVSACGPRTKQQRQAYGDRRTDEATLLLNEAERELRNQKPERAEPLLAEAKEVLAHPDVDLSPEAEMCRSQLAELQALVPKVREERARRERTAREDEERKRLEAAVEKQRDDVVQAMAEVSTALDGLEEKDAGRAQVDAVREAIQRTRERLKAGKELEAKNEDYAASTRSTERRLEQAEARLRVAQRVIEFVSGPYGDSQEAAALEKKARQERDLEARLSLYTDVRERFVRCGEAAEKLLAELPELAKGPLQVKGRPIVLKVAAAGCKKKAGSLQSVVVKLEKAKVKQEAFREKLEKAKAKREAAKAAFAEKLEKAKAARAEKLEKAKAARAEKLEKAKAARARKSK